MNRILFVLCAPLAACHVGGGERSWQFDPADVQAVSIDFANGDIVVLAEHTDVVLVDWGGGGLGRDPMGHAEIIDGVLWVGNACQGACGGDLDLLVPAGVPVSVHLDFGDIDLELQERAHIDACLRAGDLDIAVPGGGYVMALDVGAGDLDTAGVWSDDQADTVISACVGAGDLTVRARE